MRSTSPASFLSEYTFLSSIRSDSVEVVQPTFAPQDVSPPGACTTDDVAFSWRAYQQARRAQAQRNRQAPIASPISAEISQDTPEHSCVALPPTSRQCSRTHSDATDAFDFSCDAYAPSCAEHTAQACLSIDSPPKIAKARGEAQSTSHTAPFLIPSHLAFDPSSWFSDVAFSYEAYMEARVRNNTLGPEAPHPHSKHQQIHRYANNMLCPNHHLDALPKQQSVYPRLQLDLCTDQSIAWKLIQERIRKATPCSTDTLSMGDFQSIHHNTLDVIWNSNISSYESLMRFLGILPKMRFNLLPAAPASETDTTKSSSTADVLSKAAQHLLSKSLYRRIAKKNVLLLNPLNALAISCLQNHDYHNFSRILCIDPDILEAIISNQQRYFGQPIWDKKMVYTILAHGVATIQNHPEKISTLAPQLVKCLQIYFKEQSRLPLPQEPLRYDTHPFAHMYQYWPILPNTLIESFRCCLIDFWRLMFPDNDLYSDGISTKTSEDGILERSIAIYCIEIFARASDQYLKSICAEQVRYGLNIFFRDTLPKLFHAGLYIPRQKCLFEKDLKISQSDLFYFSSAQQREYAWRQEVTKSRIQIGPSIAEKLVFIRTQWPIAQGLQ